MVRMLIRWPLTWAVLGAGATIGAAWAWWWAAGYEPPIPTDDDYFVPEEG